MLKSIREFDVLPTNSPEQNTENLQKAFDWAGTQGASLFVDPCDEPYQFKSGLILKKNASLIGVHGPVGRGTSHSEKKEPVGSVLAIVDDEKPFITVEGATQLRGLQFYYPNQTITDPAKVIEYPPTIQVSKREWCLGVTLSCLTFYGEFVAMDFESDTIEERNEQILFEHCYGYPLSGQFIKIKYCWDIPRVLHCHVNPANLRYFKGEFSNEIIDSVIARGTYAYSIDNTDNAQMMDVFTFGTYGGIFLGPASYGQLTNFNLDCVCVGVHKCGDSPFNRNWQISQGSIIANAGPTQADVHPLIIEGQGHTSLVNIEAFSGLNGVLTAYGKSQDYMIVRGDTKSTICMFGCRMRDYLNDHPFTVENPNSVIQAVACIDKDQKLFNETINAEG